jgi:hypothetical protein
MNRATVLSQRSLRRDQVLEIHFSPMPDPPHEMMKLPGVRAWVEQLKLMRDRDIQSFHRLVNNLQISSNNAGQE